MCEALRTELEQLSEEEAAAQQALRALRAAAEREKLGEQDSLDVAMLSAVRALASAKGLSFE